MSDPAREPTSPPASRRILAAARALVARGGADAVSMGDVAASAGVSKALVHYHFHDKDTLLHALVEDVGLATIDRARAAMAGDDAMHALDAYWAWLEHELHTGDIAILLALAEYASPRVREVSRRIADRRRDVAAEHVAHVFGRLELTPRVPMGLIGQTVAAFTDGIAATHALEPERDARPAFDVLWLALLTLAD